MKTLLVLRHVKASQDSPSGMDFDRPLKPRGHRQSLALGQMMRERGMTVEAIVASPATRVVETISSVIEGAELACEPKYDRRIYNASPEALSEVVRQADDNVECLLIAGHNPGLQSLILHLAQQDDNGLRADVASAYPTATLAELRLSIEHWRDVGRDSGRIVSLLRPDD
ncbi:MAG: histidine phosphatase family protein [Sphingomicrobium sp.]